MTYIRFLLISAGAMVLCSCWKARDIPPNQITTITGRFYDRVNDIVYPNIKVRVAEFQQVQKFLGPGGSIPVGFPDSTTTDANGYYKLRFTTNGRGSVYYIQYKGIPADVEAYGNGGLPQYYNTGQRIDTFGKAAVYDVNIIKLYYFNIWVIIHNNPYPLFGVLAEYAYRNLFFYGSNNDSTTYIEIPKRTSGFHLYFYVTDRKTGNSYMDTSALINPVINHDTIQGDTYDLYPATFKKE